MWSLVRIVNCTKKQQYCSRLLNEYTSTALQCWISVLKVFCLFLLFSSFGAVAHVLSSRMSYRIRFFMRAHLLNVKKSFDHLDRFEDFDKSVALLSV